LTSTIPDEARALEERIAALEAQLEEQRRATRDQGALYRIAALANAADGMEAFYKGLHEILSGLLYAENLYVALYDEERQLINFPFYVDTVDDDLPDPHAWLPRSDEFARGVTGYILRTGNAVHPGPDLIYTKHLIEAGEFEYVGAVSIDYIGVPLKTDGHTIGALAVQTYVEGQIYTQDDVNLMVFVADHIAAALARTRGAAEIRQRNAELAIVNEVAEALVKELDYQAIIDAVGDRVSQILDSHDLSIAVIDQQTKIIKFPYWIENGLRDLEVTPIKLGEGLTSQIIQSGEPIRTGTAEEAIARGALMYGESQESFLGVPIRAGDTVLGVLSVSQGPANAFTPADEQLLSTIASSMGVALENARLFGETKRLLGQTEEQNAELAVVNEVGQALAKQLDLAAVTELVGERLHSIFPDIDLFVALYDRDTNLISFPYEIGHGERYHTDPIPADKGLTARVIETRKSLLIRTHEEAEKHGAVFVLENELNRTESWLGVPVITGDDLIGVLALEADRANSFDEDTQRLVETIASSTAVALHNARLFDETKRLLTETEQHAGELAIINDIGSALAEQLDFERIIELVGDRLFKMFKSPDFYIALVDKASNKITFPYELDGGKRVHGDPIEIGQGISSRVISERRAYRFATLEEQSQFGGALVGTYAELPEGVSTDQLTQSWLGVPIMAGREAIGVVVLGDRRPNVYTDADERLVSTVASSMGVALENARLFDETKHLLAETEQRNAELAVINEIGEALSRQLDFQGIIDAVGDRIRSIFNVSTELIVLYDPATETVTLPYTVDQGRRIYPPPGPLTGLTARVVLSKQPLRIGTNDEARALGASVIDDTTDEAHSWLGVPILAGDRILGVIALERLPKDAFSESDFSRLLLRTWASLSKTHASSTRRNTCSPRRNNATQSWRLLTRSVRLCRRSSNTTPSSMLSATRSARSLARKT
jgi:GAF domain-containing protein